MAGTADLPTGLTAEDRRWIDWRMDWLCSQLGDSILRDSEFAQPASLAPEHVPAGTDSLVLDGNDRTIERFVASLVDWVNLEDFDVLVRVVSSQEPPVALDRDERVVINVATNEAQNEDELPSTLVNRVCQAVLLQFTDVNADCMDLQPLADLTAVFFGLGGLITCVAPESSNDGYGSGPSRGCALNLSMLGYALGIYAYLRGEVHPDWLSDVPSELGAAVGASQDFLASHGLSGVPQGLGIDAFEPYLLRRFAYDPEEAPSESELGDEATIAYQEDDEELDSPLDDSNAVDDEPHDHAPYIPDRKPPTSRQSQPLEDEPITPRPVLHAPERDNAPCLKCGEPTRAGNDYCDYCLRARQISQSALRDELAKHSESFWPHHIAVLIILVTLISLVILALTNGAFAA